MFFVFLGKTLPDGRFNFNYPDRLRMAHHVHILKALERIGQYVAHRLFIRVISLCEDTVMFFDDLSARSPVFVKRSEICDDIVGFSPVPACPHFAKLL